MIDKLIKIADFLDKNNMGEEADVIDSIILEKGNESDGLENPKSLEHVDIPSSDYDDIMEIYKALQDSLSV